MRTRGNYLELGVGAHDVVLRLNWHKRSQIHILTVKSRCQCECTYDFLSTRRCTPFLLAAFNDKYGDSKSCSFRTTTKNIINTFTQHQVFVPISFAQQSTGYIYTLCISLFMVFNRMLTGTSTPIH